MAMSSVDPWDVRRVEQVREFGGVLEHPKNSRLFAHLGLPLPGSEPDAFGGYTVEVDQLHWGHVAHKRTWLYLVDVPDEFVKRPPPFPARQPTHDLMGGRGRNSKAKREGLREASKELRRRTPIAFAEFLVRLRASVVPEHQFRDAVRERLIRSEPVAKAFGNRN